MSASTIRPQTHHLVDTFPSITALQLLQDPKSVDSHIVIVMLKVGGMILLLALPFLYVYAEHLLCIGAKNALAVWLLLSLIVWVLYLYGLFRLCLYLFGP